MSDSDPRRRVRGRGSECETLDRLLEGVRAGQSRVLVLRGEAGVGKSALLEYLLARASGCRIAPAAGVESEMELPFAGLHQLCAPLLDRVPRLPGPQSDALRTAFGLTRGDPPDRFLVGLAVLSLLAEVAEDRPLICVIDDAQWLDLVSAQTLSFVARRLLAERVALVFAVREPSNGFELAGLPELVLGAADQPDRTRLPSATRTSSGRHATACPHSGGRPRRRRDLAVACPRAARDTGGLSGSGRRGRADRPRSIGAFPPSDRALDGVSRGEPA
jgi:hypothetical protein